ncbi:universal stress protein [Lyngbya aestuarii]|uniref:universal stress protein n=1 Tax=Lyngbya aestuarii TaxID=118322 RepID=UPI00403DC3C5
MVFNKILVAIDRSSQAAAVFSQALELAQKQESNLRLLHCVTQETPVPTGSFLGIGTLGDVNLYGSLQQQKQQQLQQEIEASRDWLQTYCQQATTQGVAAELDCQVNDPGVKICEVAQSWGADLIVIGRRGREGITEILLGSVSNYVVHHAPCSVLVIQGVNQLIQQYRNL